MWELLLSTVVTSAADSVHPLAITQRFVLQGLVLVLYNTIYTLPLILLYFV